MIVFIVTLPSLLSKLEPNWKIKTYHRLPESSSWSFCVSFLIVSLTEDNHEGSEGKQTVSNSIFFCRERHNGSNTGQARDINMTTFIARQLFVQHLDLIKCKYCNYFSITSPITFTTKTLEITCKFDTQKLQAIPLFLFLFILVSYWGSFRSFN